ncbi:MAG: S8 family serine peptidase [Sedimentisphaerales bacterium]|nr:S8 family serine peptidase [Sedimentisphaerales bacterium]
MTHIAKSTIGTRIVKGLRKLSQRSGSSMVHTGNKLPRVLMVEPLESRVLLSAAFDLIHLTDMRADPDFAGIDGSGVSVAVIDTGLDHTHTALAGNYVTGLDFVTHGAYPTPVADHGTHVAGIVGSTNPEIGVATDVGLIGLQVFTEIPGQGVAAFNQDTESALRWVLDNRETYNIVAVNMSLGSGFYTSSGQAASDIYADEIASLEAAGVTVVAAAGNSYGISQDPNTGQYVNRMYPNSGSPGILSTLDVGAVWETDEGDGYIWGGNTIDLTTDADRITSFSQRPPLAEGNVIFAPGAMINSTIPGGGFAEMPGTSMASPMVAGVVALMQEAAMQFGGRYLSPAEVTDIIISTGDNIFDGDDENVTAFIDSNGDYTITQDELITFDATNLTYKRINAHEAMKEIKSRFDGIAPPPPGGDPGSGDANGTIAGAYIGPTLDGSPVSAILGSIGTDGASVNVGDKDVDMYRFTLASAGTVTIETASHTTSVDDFDTFLRLFDPAGAQLAFDDDGAGAVGGFSKIETTLAAGTYYVGVSGYNNSSYDPNTALSGVSGAMGNYSLALSMTNDDPNGLISGAVEVNIGQGWSNPWFYGSIGTDYGKTVGTDDVDLFKVVVPDDGTLFLDIDTYDTTGYVDSYMRIFDSSGHELTWSDDDLSYDINGTFTEFTDAGFPGIVFENWGAGLSRSGHTTDSFIAGTVNRGDVYYIGISDYYNWDYNPNSLAGRSAAGTGGTYEFYVSFMNNDVNGSIPQALNISASAMPLVNQPGIIGWDGTGGGLVSVGDRDVDFVHIVPATSGVLEIDIDSYSAPSITNPVDTVLYLMNSAGQYLAGNDDMNSWDPLLRYDVQAGTSYYVAVAGYGNDNFDPFQLGSGSPGDTGEYLFSASIVSSASMSSYTNDKISDSGITTLVENAQAVTGFIGSDNGYVQGATDVDLYRYVPAFSGQAEIRTDLINSDYNSDTYLRVFNSAGTELASNDDESATSINSSITMSVVYGQTYYIGVNGASANAGQYSPITGAGAASGSQGDYSVSVLANTSGPTQIPFVNGSAAFIDTSATARLIGSGSGCLIYTNGDTNPPDVVLDGTTTGTMLMISGAATVNDVDVNGSLSFLYGTQTDIAGTVDISGSLRTAMVDDFLNGSNVYVRQSGSGLTLMADSVGAVDFDIDDTVNMFMAGSYDGGIMYADAVSMMFIRSGDLDAAVRTRVGDIGMLFVPNGNVAGEFNSANDISMLFAPSGQFSGIARAANNIGMVYCGSTFDTLISSGGNINMVYVTGNLDGTNILAGYDVGVDATFGNGGSEDDSLSSGNINMVMAGGVFSESWIAAGCLPSVIPAASSAANLGLAASSGSISMVRFGSIDSSTATGPFGLYAAGTIGSYGLTPDALFQIVPNWV